MSAPAQALEHTLRARDGWRLSVLELPARGEPRGLVIAGHAMMVDRRTLVRAGRPCLAAALADAGLRVLVPDLRGHGKSGPGPARGGDWSYDQLVEDTADYLGFARALAPDLPVATLGHSLFGHTVLAWLSGQVDPPLAAHVAIASDVWTGDDRVGSTTRLARAAIFAAVALVVRARGWFPARRLGIGTADEAHGYFADVLRGHREGRWRARDGADWRAGLSRISCPVLHVVSAGDRLYTPPGPAARLTAEIARRELWVLGEAAPPALAGLRPTHMGLVTDPASAPVWRAIADWLLARMSA